MGWIHRMSMQHTKFLLQYVICAFNWRAVRHAYATLRILGHDVWADAIYPIRQKSRSHLSFSFRLFCKTEPLVLCSSSSPGGRSSGRVGGYAQRVRIVCRYLGWHWVESRRVTRRTRSCWSSVSNAAKPAHHRALRLGLGLWLGLFR